jgi:hypothetical protein
MKYQLTEPRKQSRDRMEGTQRNVTLFYEAQ